MLIIPEHVKHSYAENDLRFSWGLLEGFFQIRGDSISLFPLYWCVITSLKPPAFILKQLSLINYVKLISGADVANAPMVRWFLNSFLASTASTFGVVLLASLVSYSFVLNPLL